MASSEWTLLIYTVPSQPSRKRATIWRELKKVGALYLRDGVATLPHSTETVRTFRAIAARVEAFEGTAIVAEQATLDAERSALLWAQLAETRAGEYAEIAQEATSF